MCKEALAWRGEGLDRDGSLTYFVCFDLLPLFTPFVFFISRSITDIPPCSPACIVSFGLTALRRGEFADAWAWSDAPGEDESEGQKLKTVEAKESVMVEGIDTLSSRSTTPKAVKHSGGRR